MNKNILNKHVLLVNFNKKTPTIFNVSYSHASY